MNVEFWIHNDPAQSSSGVDFKILLTLLEEDRSGDSVGWRITTATFEDTQLSPMRSWAISNPRVPSLDGLWWVKHVDPDDPQLAEFRNPPHLSGIAEAVNATEANLDYDLEGQGPSPVTPWPITALLTYSFKEVGQSSPLKQNQDEPVEVPQNTPPN